MRAVVLLSMRPLLLLWMTRSLSNTVYDGGCNISMDDGGSSNAVGEGCNTTIDDEGCRGLLLL